MHQWFESAHLTSTDIEVLDVVGVKSRGRSKKICGECVREDLMDFGLKKDWTQDREKWNGLTVVGAGGTVQLQLAWKHGLFTTVNGDQ